MRTPENLTPEQRADLAALEATYRLAGALHEFIANVARPAAKRLAEAGIPHADKAAVELGLAAQSVVGTPRGVQQAIAEMLFEEVQP